MTLKTVIKQLSADEYIKEFKTQATNQTKLISIPATVLKKLPVVSTSKFDSTIYKAKQDLLLTYIENKLIELEVKYEKKNIAGGITTPLKYSKHAGATKYSPAYDYIRVFGGQGTVCHNKNLYINVLPYTYAKNAKVKINVSHSMESSQTGRYYNGDTVMTNIKTTTRSAEIEEFKNKLQSQHRSVESFESKDNRINVDDIIAYIKGYYDKCEYYEINNAKNAKINSLQVATSMGGVKRKIKQIAEDVGYTLCETFDQRFSDVSKTFLDYSYSRDQIVLSDMVKLSLIANSYNNDQDLSKSKCEIRLGEGSYNTFTIAFGVNELDVKLCAIFKAAKILEEAKLCSMFE